MENERGALPIILLEINSDSSQHYSHKVPCCTEEHFSWSSFYHHHVAPSFLKKTGEVSQVSDQCVSLLRCFWYV